jgi:hypothetical protein
MGDQVANAGALVDIHRFMAYLRVLAQLLRHANQTHRYLTFPDSTPWRWHNKLAPGRMRRFMPLARHVDTDFR